MKITLEQKKRLLNFVFAGIWHVELRCRSANCLAISRITHVWQILVCTDKELLSLKGMGKKSLRDIREATEGPFGDWENPDTRHEQDKLLTPEFRHRLRQMLEESVEWKCRSSNYKVLTIRDWYNLPSSIDKLFSEMFEIVD